MITVSQMLDLPRDERSRYLRAMPLTRTFVFDCLEPWHIRHVRRVITRHGGVYREVYAAPGVFFVATFRAHRGLLACARDVAAWLNDQAKTEYAAADALGLDLPDSCLSVTATDVAKSHGDVPALAFERIGLGGASVRPAHPIMGGAL